MIIVDVTKERNIESALRVYKNKVQKIKIIQELRNRKEFVKPSVTKRKQKLKAIYTAKKRNGLN
jgi:small subunit ribosomal protein S21